MGGGWAVWEKGCPCPSCPLAPCNGVSRGEGWQPAERRHAGLGEKGAGKGGKRPPWRPSLARGRKKKLPRGFPLLFQSKLVKYFSRQLSCKRKVALQERNAKLEGFPQLLHWFRIVDIRKEVMEVRRGHGAHGREACCGILE